MKTCNVTGCNNPVWGKGVCKTHTSKYPIKRSPIGEKSLKVLDDVFKKEFYKQNRNTFFMEIWKERPHVCEHCGKSLGREPLSYMFDHILEKSKHQDLSFEKDNMWLVCLSCHDNKTRGILTDKYKEKINFVKTKFDRS